MQSFWSKWKECRCMSLAWMEKQGRIAKHVGKNADFHKAGWVRTMVIVTYMKTEESKEESMSYPTCHLKWTTNLNVLKTRDPCLVGAVCIIWCFQGSPLKSGLAGLILFMKFNASLLWCSWSVTSFRDSAWHFSLWNVLFLSGLKCSNCGFVYDSEIFLLIQF